MNHPTRSYLIAILLVSVLLRTGVGLYLGDTTPVGKDETSYSTLAARLASGHGVSFGQPWYPFTPAGAPTSHWSFLYTAFVAGVYAVVGPHPLAARLVQAVLAGLLLPWLTYRLAGRVTASGADGEQASTRIALLAAFLSAIYAYFVLYGAMVQTEAFFICALLWSLERALALASAFGHRAPDARYTALSSRCSTLCPALTLGLSLGLATLLRQSILPWVIVLFAWLLWGAVGPEAAGGRHRAARAVAPLGLSGLVLLACIAPFTVRNTVVYGDFLLLNSNAGYAMYSAQHPMHGTSFQEYAAAPLPEDLAAQGLNEASWDKELMRRGIGFVLAEPGRYLLLSLSRVRDYFEFWPTADSSPLFNLGRVASIGLFLPFMLYGIWLAMWEGKVKTGSSHAAPPAPAIHHTAFNPRHSSFLLLFAGFYSLLHIATWAMSRYRLPVDAVMLIFAAAAIRDLGGRLGVGSRGMRGNGVMKTGSEAGSPA